MVVSGYTKQIRSATEEVVVVSFFAISHSLWNRVFFCGGGSSAFVAWDL